MFRITITSIISELALVSMVVTLVVPGSILQISFAQHQPTAVTSRETNTNFRTYSNSVLGIKMQYPSNWLKLNLSRSSSPVPVVAFMHPAGKPVAALFLSGNVNNGNITLAAIVNVRENQLKLAGNNLHLVTSTPATLAGNPAHKIVYTMTAPKGKFQAMQLISLVGKKAYFITYVVPAANYTTYLPAIETILNSTKINK